ncbi:MAG: ABC transporter ATP-binding protein [Bacteroidia bacterium]|nr:ABC transporter ATP-binding protein [Bacteroidia bacterium]
MKDKHVLKIENLVWGYDAKGLVNQPVSIEVSTPSFILLLGANGTGKSTLLKTIGAVLRPVKGALFFNGESIEKYKKRGGFVSFVFAQRPQVDFMKVSDLVLSGLYLHQNPFLKISPEQMQRYDFAVKVTRIEHLQHHFVNKISDGEFQKVMIARALVQDTPLILLDEPTAFIDYRSKRELFSLLAEISRQENKIIIASTHDPDLAQEKGEDFWLIKDHTLHQLNHTNLAYKKLKEELM